MSPKQMSAVVDHSLNLVSYHMSQVLFKECGLIEIHEEIPRRGAIEHIFRIKPEATLGHPDWQRMVPKIMAGEVRAKALKSFIEQLMAAAAAIDPSVLDPKDPLGWIPVTVDEQGRKKVAKVLSQAFERVAAIEAESRDRVEAGARGTDLIVGIAAFEAGTNAGGE